MVNFQFQDFIYNLQSWGVADVLLPFLLIFTIIFAILQKAEIFGQGKKNFNVVIALIIGLSVVIPHVLDTYPSGYDVVDIMNEALPQISLLAVAFLMMLLLVGLFGIEWKDKSITGLFAIISIVGIVWIFGGAMDWWETGWFENSIGSETLSVVIMILVFGLIIWFITKEEKTTRGQTTGEGIKNLFKWFAGED